MSRPRYHKVILFLGIFILASLVFSLSSSVQAQPPLATYTLPLDITTEYESDVYYWDLFEELPSGQAVTSGKLSFNALGINNSTEGKLHLAGMIDKDLGTDINDRSYFIQIRRNISEFVGVLPQASVKGRIDCSWFDGQSSADYEIPWDPSVNYNVQLSWDSTSTSLQISGEDGLNISATATLPRKFAPLQQTVFFGNPPSSAGYEALTGVTYSNIVLEAYEFSDGVRLEGDRCISEESDVDDPNNPYDTCACHAIPDVTAPPPCEDPIARSDPRKTSFLDTGFPFKFAGLALKWTWSLGNIIDEAGQKEEETAAMPEIMVTFAPPSPLPDSDAQAIAAMQNFRTRMPNLYFGWCMVDDGQVYPFNSVVAGGQELPELTQPDLTWEGGGCCQPLTRVPEEDLDGDGMDDNWERLKFLNRSNYGYTSIEEVLPNDDPDGDGYYANTFKNNKGEYLTVTPYLIDSLGNTYATGTADAKLTNIEEYILDTDPLNGDTDGDGYKDEMDFIGVGQMQFQFPVEKESGPDGFYDISVAVVGINSVKKTSFVSDKRRLFVGSEGALKVNLQSSQPTITFGDDSSPVTLDVTLLQGSEDMADMFYEWSFNNEPACDGNEPDFPELCDEGQLGGMGKSTVTLGGEGIDLLSLPEPTSGDYPVSVRVTSPVTGNEDQTSINLNTALPVNLVTDGCGGQTEPVEALPADSKIPTMVCISEIEQLMSGDDTSLNFVWSKDGQVDTAQSGLGKSQYALFPTKPAGESHTVAVIVKDAMEAKEIVNANLTLPIEGPAIEIISPPVRSRDPVSPAASRYITGEPGQDIEIKAELKNFNSSEGFEYTWIVGEDEPYSEEINNTISTYTFKIPEESSYGSSFDVSVMAKSLNLENVQQASESLTLVISEDEVQTGAGVGFFDNLAAVFSVIPAAFQKLLVFAAIAAGVFFGLVYLYPKIPRRVLNKLPLGHKEWQGGYRSSAEKLSQEKKLAHKLRHEQRHNFSDEEED